MNKDLSKNLPKLPGVYLFKDKRGNILYVGKAKNLIKRVRTYFQATQKLAPDKKIMVSQIEKMDHIVTSSELEALLLETNLIKKYRPKYNIRLKDDKNHQYIKIDYSWDYPKIYTVRKIEPKQDAQYFGPFTDGTAVKKTIELLRKLFRYRTCNREIPYDTNKPYKSACLNYHIKLCFAPCIGAIRREEYEDTIHKCVQLLEGKQKQIKKEIKASMKKAAIDKNFEKAAVLRDQLKDIEHITAKQKVISTNYENLDIVSFFTKKKVTAFNLFLVRDGKLLGKENFLLDHEQETPDEEIMASFLKFYYSTAKNIPHKIILEKAPSPDKGLEKLLGKILNAKKQTFHIPQKGKLKKLIKLGKTNAREYLDKINPASDETTDLTTDQQAQLGLKKMPHRIECYDISNLQGSNATGSMSVLINGETKPSEYRKFKIKGANTPDDVRMIKEVLSRRFDEKHEDWPRPDLIIIDGGKPQLNAASQILKKLKVKIPLISLAKREEEIFVAGQDKPLKLATDNPVLQTFQKARDEAHRFAVSYHVKLRQKKSIQSSLDNIPGIGPKTKKQLLQKFGSVAAIRKASTAEISELVGDKKALLIKENL